MCPVVVMLDVESIKSILINYAPTTIFISICSVLLAWPDRGIIQILFGLGFAHWWVYFIHRGLHDLPREGVFSTLNTHWMFHHQQTKLIDRRLELVLETFTDLGMNLSLGLLQWATGIWFVPFSVMLFFALTYTSTHIINYSIIGSDTHRAHHKNLDTNFGPDPMDHLFGTNDDTTHENLLPMSLNALGAFIVVYMLKQHYGWVD